MAGSGSTRERLGVGGRRHTEVPKYRRGDLHDGLRSRIDPDRQHRDLGVATPQGAVTPTAGVMAAGQIGELESRGGGDDHLTRVRIVQRSPCSVQTAWIPEHDLVPGRAPPIRPAGKAQFLSFASRDRGRSFEEQDGLCRLFLVEPLCERPCVGRGTAEPIQHSGPVRRGDEHVVEIPERRLQANVLGDMRLPVVRAENNRVTLEELLRPAGRVEERADRGIASRQGFESPIGAMSVRGEVVVR